MSTTVRWISVDDTDPDIGYVGNSWFPDVGSLDSIGNNGPPFLSTLHGTNSSASFTFNYTGRQFFGFPSYSNSTLCFAYIDTRLRTEGYGYIHWNPKCYYNGLDLLRGWFQRAWQDLPHCERLLPERFDVLLVTFHTGWVTCSQCQCNSGGKPDFLV